MELDVKFSAQNQANMAVEFTESTHEIDAGFGEIQIVNAGAPVYSGEYVVTPKVHGQMMPTKGKNMVDDVTINPIPFFKTSNTSGGHTVYIAKEI